MNGLLYSVGGHDGPVVRKSVESYNPDTNRSVVSPINKNYPNIIFLKTQNYPFLGHKTDQNVPIITFKLKKNPIHPREIPEAGPLPPSSPSHF